MKQLAKGKPTGYRTSRGRQLDNLTIERIKAMYATGVSKQAIADELNLSWATVDKYSKLDEDGFEELRAKRQKEFVDACWRNITEAIELGNQKVALAKMAAKDFKEMVDKTAQTLKDQGADPQVIAEVVKAMSKMGDIPLAHISTYIGTLYDKQALAQGDPTEITENITRWSDLDD
jgi:predicted transcriptional regulator